MPSVTGTFRFGTKLQITKLVQRLGSHLPASGRGTTEGLVVPQHENAVPGHPHVDLQQYGALRERVLEGWNRVLRNVLDRPAPKSPDQRRRIQLQVGREAVGTRKVAGVRWAGRESFSDGLPVIARHTPEEERPGENDEK